MRVGLVLGGGGVLGAAWLRGALHALSAETGWDPRDADQIVGTSAGAMIGALCACGVSASRLAGAGGDDRSRSGGPRRRSKTASYRVEGGLPPLGPGSWRLAVAALARPGRHTPTAVATGLLPRGAVSHEPLRAMVRSVAGDGWAPHPSVWVVACDYRSGEHVVFGREGSPPASLADAVAASCAIPGFYRPVEIGGRLYVDGGVRSPSNLDLLAGEGLDLVVCLNPTSSREGARTLGARAGTLVRGASGRRLGAELRALRESGTEVVAIEPSGADLDAMGVNLMARGRRRQVLETAVASVREMLRDPGLRSRLERLGAAARAASAASPASRD